MLPDDDPVGPQIGGESADAPADLGDPTLMGMPADQANPLDEVTIETNDTTNNVQPPARDTPMVAAGGAPPGGADPISGKLQTSVDYNKRVALTQADA